MFLTELKGLGNYWQQQVGFFFWAHVQCCLATE